MEVASGKRQNSLYFAGVFLGLWLAAWGISYVIVLTLDVYQPGLMALMVFYLAAYLSGKHYVSFKDNAWTRDDRHRLAVGYVIIATIMSSLLQAPFLFVPALGAGAFPWADPTFLALMGFILLLGVMAEYGIARWVFGEIMKRAPKGGDVQ